MKIPWPRVGAALNILGLFSLFGGALLTLLLGPAAWASTDKGETYRLATGALVIGLLLGFVCYSVWPGVLWFIADSSAKAWTAFAGIPIILLILVFFLRHSRQNLG